MWPRSNHSIKPNSVTTVGQVLKDNWIYVGIPCKEFKQNWFFEDGLEDKLGVVEDVDALLGKYDKIITKVRWDENLTLKERKAIKRQQKEEEERRWERSKEFSNSIIIPFHLITKYILRFLAPLLTVLVISMVPISFKWFM
ncbi:MAG: hypothetical protein ACTSP9_19070 [Promethearchaeota archaeon]